MTTTIFDGKPQSGLPKNNLHSGTYKIAENVFQGNMFVSRKLATFEKMTVTGMNLRDLNVYYCIIHLCLILCRVDVTMNNWQLVK